MPKLSKKRLRELSLMANTIRQDIVTMVSVANSGHPGGALGMVDIFSALYFQVLKHKPKSPSWKDRERLVLSNGHICAVRYSAMARAGYFPVKELSTFRKINSRLQGHPSYVDLMGVESSSGSLGQGLGIAVGMALANKLDKNRRRTYVVVSDGELDEGSSWEALVAASKWKLNLTIIVDRNNIQISGKTNIVWPINPLNKKFKAFNINTLSVDGHNIQKFIDACATAKKKSGPSVIIARTVLGKGVSFMQNQAKWHGKPPSHEELIKALEELHNQRERIKNSK